jgi:hypothetical protein
MLQKNYPEQFYMIVKDMIQYHMSIIKKFSNHQNIISEISYRKEFKTLRISSTRSAGHTYVALRILEEVPTSLMIVHSEQHARTLIKNNIKLNLNDRILTLNTAKNSTMNRFSNHTIPIIIIDTMNLFESRKTSFEQLEKVINGFDHFVNVKLFLYLQ